MSVTIAHIEYDYAVAQQVAITAAFVNEAGAAVNPASVVFMVKDATGVETKKTWPVDAEVTNPATGSFRFAFDIARAGRHEVRVKGTGGVKAAMLSEFTVAPHIFSE